MGVHPLLLEWHGSVMLCNERYHFDLLQDGYNLYTILNSWFCTSGKWK